LVSVQFLENDVISSVRKRFCILGLRLGRVTAGANGSAFSVKRVFEQV